MNASQIHLALTHVPVILSLVGLVVLVVALLRKNDTLTKTAFYLLLFAGVTAIPVFVTGEGAEETVEHLPGVSEDVIGTHEEVATVSFIVVSVAAFVSLIGLLLYNKAGVRRFVKPVVLVLALVTASLMTVTAHLGGQVRHTEIRSGFTPQNENGTNNAVQNRGGRDND